MSDGEPRAFRTILVVASTITVLVAAATGFLLWWLAREPEAPGARRPADGEEAGPEGRTTPR